MLSTLAVVILLFFNPAAISAGAVVPRATECYGDCVTRCNTKSTVCEMRLQHVSLDVLRSHLVQLPSQPPPRPQQQLPKPQQQQPKPQQQQPRLQPRLPR
ncbi:hypothetical protein HK096_008853, partial [Nowakowskiella sp. JEL0078]